MFFFFNDTATTEIYTLSLHDALPILRSRVGLPRVADRAPGRQGSGAEEGLHDAATDPRRLPRLRREVRRQDRKSTRLNSSHSQISYAVFCLKKKKKTKDRITEHPVKR